MNNNNQNSSGIFVIIAIVILVIIMAIAFSNDNNSSTKSQSSYEKSLYDAYDKIQDGEQLSPSEQRAWEDFKEWERKNY